MTAITDQRRRYRLNQTRGTASATIMHNYAQTLEITDRIMLMHRSRMTYESHSAATSVVELMEIVRREYRDMPAT